ncbi:MAG: hypothetical protein HDT42_10245 [Ruminococcaceae bacterium]|nr:hypothetical protein [Oscillospiraceae bacterium]
MKKIVSMGIAFSVTALTSIAALAESADSSTSEESVQGTYLTAAKTAGDYVNGSNVTFSVKVTQSGITKGGFMVKAEGLEFVSSDVEGGEFSAESGAATFTGDSYDKDSVVATFTYKVIAKTGENVRFAISEHEDYPGAVDPIPVTGLVIEGTSASGTSSTPATSSTTSGNSSTINSGNSNGTTNSPATGAAFTLVPLVLTGAAIVVAARKRK